MLCVGLVQPIQLFIGVQRDYRKHFEECTREVPYRESCDGGPLQLR